MALRWYVVQAYSGYEGKVKGFIEARIKQFALEEKFGQVLVPTEEVVEMRDGQKRKSARFEIHQEFWVLLAVPKNIPHQ